MIFQHFSIIHLVDAVSGCDDHIRFMALFEPVQILIKSICRSTVPVIVIHGQRRSKEIQSALFSSKVPPFGGAQMLIQRTGIVLGQNCHLLHMGIGHIAQCKINAPITSCYRHGRNGALLRKFSHPMIIAAC